jgi:hypothetical protein
MPRYYALRVVVTALLDVHPDPDIVLPHLDLISEHMKAAFLNTRLSDEALADFERELASLRKRLESRLTGLSSSNG